MTCIKTGCVVYLMNYNEWIYGDAHEYDGVLVVRAVMRTRDVQEIRDYGSVRHITVMNNADWWDDNDTSMRHQSTLIVSRGMWSNHGYEGVQEPQLENLTSG